MKYYFDKPDKYYKYYGITYKCDHPIYNYCTLYLIDNMGLAVIQQRFNKINKTTYWSEIDPWLNDELYLNAGFKSYFNKYSGICMNGLYPTVSIRQIMWGLKMKPLKRLYWETSFDHCPI